RHRSYRDRGPRTARCEFIGVNRRLDERMRKRRRTLIPRSRRKRPETHLGNESDNADRSGPSECRRPRRRRRGGADPHHPSHCQGDTHRLRREPRSRRRVADVRPPCPSRRQRLSGRRSSAGRPAVDRGAFCPRSVECRLPDHCRFRRCGRFVLCDWLWRPRGGTGPRIALLSGLPRRHESGGSLRGCATPRTAAPATSTC
ncbi:MAG: hypothetical protein H6Q99_3410, partial [Proteobacteria bacterium]|nr:hypothetical protein [Pseudomonadota bacterium]